MDKQHESEPPFGTAQAQRQAFGSAFVLAPNYLSHIKSVVAMPSGVASLGTRHKGALATLQRSVKEMEPRISIITLGVKDMAKAIRFYRDGLGFNTKASDDAPIAFFETSGTRLAVYPLKELRNDISECLPIPDAGFNGITLAHNVREKKEVTEVLKLAESAGGKVVKEAQDVFWGGHSGYFCDLDGYFWEVAWSPRGEFDENGSVVL